MFSETPGKHDTTRLAVNGGLIELPGSKSGPKSLDFFANFSFDNPE